jgi:hypothetical protein
VLPPTPARKKNTDSNVTLPVKPTAKKDKAVMMKPKVKRFRLPKYRDMYPETAGRSE